MFQPDMTMENAFKFSRFDVDHPLSTSSAHPILLDDENWLTCEHYYQSKIIKSEEGIKKIAEMNSAKAAFEYTKPWYRAKVKDWKNKRRVLMTRALYTKVQMYEEVRQALLDTDNALIIETSLYDYFWGVGRDARGDNHMGKIWMDIRQKLKPRDPNGLDNNVGSA